MQVRAETDDRKLYKFTVEYKDSEGKKRTQSGRVWTENPSGFRKALLTRYDVPGTREILFITLVECEPAVPMTTSEAAASCRANLPVVVTAPALPTPTSTGNSSADKFYHQFCHGAYNHKHVPNFFEKERALFEMITTLKPQTEVKPA